MDHAKCGLCSSLVDRAAAARSVVDTSFFNLTETIGGSVEARVVHKVVGARDSGHEDPVATVINVKDDSFTSSEIFLDVVGIVDLADEAETESANGAPNKEVARYVATIVSEPLVDSLGGGNSTTNLFATVSEDHRN